MNSLSNAQNLTPNEPSRVNKNFRGENHGATLKINIAGTFAFILVLLALLWRITQGVDWSDESYYAIFIDDWLKSGITNSNLRTLHQTAALIVYPAAKIYYLLTDSSNGLFLFLRFLFVLGSVATALVWLAFLSKIIDKRCAWAAAICVLSIVPFGLPAPSYNTLAQQGLFVALGALGYVVVSANASKPQQILWLILSASGWAIVTVAYPTLLAALLFFGVLLWFRGRSLVPQFWLYATLILGLQLLAWILVINTLSWQHLTESILYLNTMNDVDNFARKIHFSLTLLRNNISFTALCIVAILTGVLRPWINTRISTLLIIGILICLCFLSPVFFLQSHDAITLTAFTGLGLIWSLLHKATALNRLLATLYATSLIAGLVTAATALNSMFNFCIGAAPAAILAIATLGIIFRDRSSARTADRLFSLGPIIIFWGIIFNIAFFHHYGELPHINEKRVWLKNSFFSGLAVFPDQVNLLDIMQNKVVPLLNTEKTIVVLGRLPGLSLATPAQVLTLVVYPITPDISPQGLSFTQQFYIKEIKHRPKVVVIYNDIYLPTINPLEPHFLNWYKNVDTYEIPTVRFAEKEQIGKISIFIKRDTQ